MISTAGFTIVFRRGCMNCERYMAPNTARGMAMISEYTVPFNVPTSSGVRLYLGSKSSLPLLDCQTYSGCVYPSYQTRPNSDHRLTSGCGLRTASAAKRSPPATNALVPLGASASAPGGTGAGPVHSSRCDVE